MNYYTNGISKLDTHVLHTYNIYKVYGTGVMEDPYYDGESVKTIICTEFEAWLITAYMNLELYGPILNRTSWESPKFNYKKIKEDGDDE